MTHDHLTKFDFIIVRFKGKWEILPASYRVEQIINLMSKDGTYQKCLKETFEWWKNSLDNESEWDDSLMRCVRGYLAEKLDKQIFIHKDI